MNQKEIVLDILENVWSNQEFGNIEDEIASPMTLHVRDSSRELNAKDLISVVQRWKEIIPDLHYKILHLISEDNIVAVNCYMKGTPIKKLKGYEPSGSISVPHVFFFKFENNKVVDVWEINDFSVLEDQLE